MKVLCVCQGGNVRSVTLAYLLKYKYGQDALACGWEPNSEETKEMLFKWADTIIILEDDFLVYIPPKYRKKTLFCDVGPDRWGMALHPDLLKLEDELLAQMMIQGEQP